MKSHPAVEISRELVTVLPLLYRFINTEVRGNDDDTTITQIRVLSYLIDAPMTLSTLARKRHVTLQAASEQVQGLVERGWVVREPDLKDRRQSLLRVSDSGRQRFKEAREQVVDSMTPYIDRLSEDESEQVYQALLTLHRLFAHPESEAQSEAVAIP